MAVVANYPRLSGDWLRHELDPRLYRKSGSVVSGAGKLITGTVVGIITASKKWAPYDPTANDGRETIKGVLLHGIDATSADAPAVFVTGKAEIVALNLTWHASVDNQTKINTGLAALEALEIFARPLA